MIRKLILLLALMPVASVAFAVPTDSTESKDNRILTSMQSSSLNRDDAPDKWQPMHANFSIQSDMLLSTAQKSKNTWFGNSYIMGIIKNNYLEFGARFEDLYKPLPGHEPEMGRGVPHMYVKGSYHWAELTMGDFYDQFGSGMVFRTYEERNLGIDNAVRGGRIVLTPFDGVRVKGIAGQQRNYFDRTGKVFNSGRGYLLGSDLELNVERWSSAMRDNDYHLAIGGSFVSKHEADEDIFVGVGEDRKRLNLPLNVPIMGLRTNFQKGGLAIYAEYGYKYNDPSADNDYIYHDGQAALLSASYSKKGMSVLLQAKRCENFAFRSKRSAQLTPLMINYMPAFTQAHTYTLAAIYPYATQPQGEWAFQGELRYNFARRTALGGRYGTGLRINVSHVRGLDKKMLKENPDELIGTDGYTVSFFGMGDLYYSDIDVEIAKKVSPGFNFTLTYLNQIYNNKVLHGAAGEKPEKIYANIFVYDGKYKLSNKVALRTELQYLHTKQDQGDWIYGMAELSILPSLMLSLSEQYNIGETKKHYVMGSVTYTHGAHRVAFSAGKTRAGMNCSGGVCRVVPETQGFYLSYSTNL
ncbi:hypothetical protein CLI72_00810 [Porphyromonas gingivalis]|mgnify:FL=1|uniref:DUF6029 family protein n=1 Tax=Porphyromonas gingivalis TaxID=837 RepID=UPI000BE70030|nr:DUF6029 family protein [Porphyromonas gingivalis]PDP84073.1 hypothetical protein CLI72_00810 [Porphyromonas gingivalis]